MFKLTKDNIRPVTSEMTLIHPVGGPTSAKVKLVGTLSKNFKDAQVALFKKLGPDTDANDLPEEERIRLFAEIYASCVVGWNDELTEAIGEYSPETAMTLFTESEIDWIGAQIASYVNKTSNFFRSIAPTVGPVGSASDEGSGESSEVEELHQDSKDLQ